MSDEIYQVWGFWITVGGTVLGFLSFLFAIMISSTTKKIREGLIDDVYKTNFKKTKSSIVKSLDTSIALINLDNKIDFNLIKQTLYDIEMYNKFFTKSTRKIIKKIFKTVKLMNTESMEKTWFTKIKGIFGTHSKLHETLSDELYRLKIYINRELDEHVEEIRGRFDERNY